MTETSTAAPQLVEINVEDSPTRRAPVSRPKEIRLRRASGTLDIIWNDGTEAAFSSTLLRSHCRCTDCRREAMRTGQPAIAAEKVVTISDIRPVGNYAVQLVFDDGHDRGIYPFRYLQELAALFPSH